MTYLHCLHHLNDALKATMPLLLARYKSLSFPGSKSDIYKDPVLSGLLAKVRAINQLTERAGRRDAAADQAFTEEDELLLKEIIS